MGGFLVALACLVYNGNCYRYSHGWTRCELEKVDYPIEVEGSFFQCTRTVGFYFVLSAGLFIYFFIVGHLLLASVSFFGLVVVCERHQKLK